MQTRFTPSLETLGDRLNLSPWMPTTEQTRQISIVVDLAPLELDLRVSASQTAIPSVTDLVIVTYNGRAAGRAVILENVVEVFDRPATLEGHECLVFFLGGIPSADAVPNDWVFGTELPQIADTQIRHRMFAIVDRTQMATEGAAILTSSLPGSDAQLARRNLV